MEGCELMTIRLMARIAIPLGLLTIAANAGSAQVNNEGLVLKSASQTGSETRYTLSGSFTYGYREDDIGWTATYQATVKAQWNAATREATERISYQQVFFEGGEVSASFTCSANPFIAIPAAWPQCKQTGFEIVQQKQHPSGAKHWQDMLKERPLTFRRTDPAEAKSLISSHAPPPPPPPSPPSAQPVDPNLGRNKMLTFPNPTWQGRRVDLCLHWSADCGQPAADEFCTLSGYTRATAWKPADKVGHTVVLGDKKLCDDARCDGFASISCVK
jgi:hypothetical protein